MSELKLILDSNEVVLMEGGVVEVLRRSGNLDFHPELIHAHFIYDTDKSHSLANIYRSYLDITHNFKSPFIICTPTWRTNESNVTKSGVNPAINIDAVSFLKDIRNEYDSDNKILIGGIIGPKNDCYKPEEALDQHEAASFHLWQIEQLQRGGVDFVIAETIPGTQEALGIAKACSSLGVDYVIGFVINRNGKILDLSDLSNAIKQIDFSVSNPPVGYFINCAHPSFLCPHTQPKELFNRLIGFLGNASSLDHCDLDGADDLHVDSIAEWGDEMITLNHTYNIKVLGGCCGTNNTHIQYLAEKIR